MAGGAFGSVGGMDGSVAGGTDGSVGAGVGGVVSIGGGAVSSTGAGGAISSSGLLQPAAKAVTDSAAHSIKVLATGLRFRVLIFILHTP
jgi:3-oxoacyl-ACP reductase-like protein